MMNTRDSAVWWIAEREGLPVPVAWMHKGPTLQDWPNLRLTVETVDRYFNGEPQNLALLMGSPKKGNEQARLADVDKDCPEAYWAWKEYGPQTGMRWGRRSNPDSHALYYAEPAAATAKYLDPVAEKENPGDACMIELRCLTKDGKIGNPVVAPPSRHPSGEDYEFVASGFATTIAGPILEARVRLTAAAAMLGRHGREGAWHEIFISLAGAFARAKWELEEAQRFIRAVYRVVWHDAADLRQANADVDSTYQKFDDGGECTGLTKLGTLLDERVFKKLKEWLALGEDESWKHQQHAPRKKPRVLPEDEPIEDLRERQIIVPEWQFEGILKTPSVLLLVSPPKTGKTVLAVEIVMSVVNGLHLFNYYKNYSKPGEAAGLIIEWDDQQAEASLKDFLLKCRASRRDQKITFVTRPKESFTIADPEFRPWLTSLIKKRGATICVLDSLTALRGFAADDKTRNVVKLDAAEITMLGEVAIETRCTIIVIHHDSKTAAALDIFSRAAGTFALQACSEAQIVLSRFPDLPLDDPSRLLSVRGRHLRGTQAVLKFCEETLDFDFLIDGEAARHYVDLRHLLHFFRGKTNFDAKKVTDETGWQKSKAYAVLSQLTSAGLLIKESTAWNWNPGWARTLEQI